MRIGTLGAALGACGSLPRPPSVKPPPAAFVEVLAPPPPARVEVLPKKPKEATCWIDGAWSWEGSRWKWTPGGWLAPPPGIRYADWVVMRRSDGTLLYANPQWYDDKGAPVASPPFLAPATSVGGGSSEQKT